MKRLVDITLDATFSAITFFANLAVSRYDDPIVAEMKRRKRACVVATASTAIAVFAALAIADGFNALASSSLFGPTVDGLRETVGNLLMWGLLGIFAYACHAYYALWRFMQYGECQTDI